MWMGHRDQFGHMDVARALNPLFCPQKGKSNIFR